MDSQIAQIITLSVLSFVAVAGCVLFFVGYGLDYDHCVGHASADVCAETFYERWWPVALELFTGVGILLAMVTGKLEEHLVAAMGFLVLSTALVMESINAAIWSIEFGTTDKSTVHAEVAGAGLLLLVLVNCTGIILLGLRYHKHEKRSTEWPTAKIVSTVIAGVWVAAGLGLMLGGVILKEIDCTQLAEGNAAQTCSYKLRFTWWTVAFESAVAVWILVAMLTGYLDSMAVPIASFLALVTSNLMDESDIALSDLMKSESVKDDLVAAGVLLLCLVNMVLLLGFALGGVLTSDRMQEGQEVDRQNALVISVGVTLLPLLLGLGMAVTGVARLHSEYCDTDCIKFFRASYWAFSFELFVVIVLCCLAFLKKESLVEVRGILQLFLVLTSLETMKEVGKMLRFNPGDVGYITNKAEDFSGFTSVGIAAAGYIVVTAMNFVLMLVIGWENSAQVNPEAYEPAP